MIDEPQKCPLCAEPIALGDKTMYRDISEKGLGRVICLVKVRVCLVTPESPGYPVDGRERERVRFRQPWLNGSSLDPACTPAFGLTPWRRDSGESGIGRHIQHWSPACLSQRRKSFSESPRS